MNGAQIDHAVISDGCILNHSRIRNSIIGLRTLVGAGTDKKPADLERAAHALRTAVRGEDQSQYARFAALVNERPPSEPRDLLDSQGADPPAADDDTWPSSGQW